MKISINELRQMIREEVIASTDDPTVVMYKVESGDTETLIINKFKMTQEEYERLNPEPFKGEGSTVKVKVESGSPPPSPPTPPINPLSYKDRGFLDDDPMKLVERAAGVLYGKLDDEIKGDFTDRLSDANIQTRVRKYFKDNNVVIIAPVSQYIKKMKAANSKRGIKEINDLLKKHVSLKVIRLLIKAKTVPASKISKQKEDQQIFIVPALKTPDGRLKIFKPSKSGWDIINLNVTVDAIDVTNEPE